MATNKSKKLTREYIFRFGVYHQAPKDGEPYRIKFPEDTMFITGGPNEVGKCKHNGAYHILAATRYENLEEITDQAFAIGIVDTNQALKRNDLRINGYGFVYLPDCIFEPGLEFTEEIEFNSKLDLIEHPQYFLNLNEYTICNIVRLNQIHSYWNVDSSEVRWRSQIGGRCYPVIIPESASELKNILVTHYKHYIYHLDNDYGQELFDDMLNQTLIKIDDVYDNGLPHFDLDWLWNNLDRMNDVFDKMSLHKSLNDPKPTEDDMKFLQEYEDIFHCKKRLPYKESSTTKHN